MNAADFLSLSYDEKLRIMTEAPQELDLPDEASLVAQYLQQYRPLLPPEHHIDNLSSLDIAETMQSVVTLDVNVVSRIMRMLGYKLSFRGESLPTWAMRHVDAVLT